ncbi:prepilin-type N-terminal cleavage/methylation domain-containing protein [bacterium]|nr:prepilin-type N-terminal cleavage/methylation domain-containing protein [bacterium]
MDSEQNRQLTHNSSLSTVHSHAFTLAETLIVMGIIGVVAALTIPNVNKNTGRAEAVAKVKKIYAELNEAHNRATAVYGPVESWMGGDSNYNKRYFDRITEFMKLQKDCGTSTGCMNNAYKNYKDSSTENADKSPAAILANGWSFHIYDKWTRNNNCNADEGYQNVCGTVFVDIDGPNKGKNTLGIDYFYFLITKDGIKPYGGGTLWTDSGSYNVKERCFYQGFCTEWVIRNGNMDYIDTNHDAEDNAGICKHGTKAQLSTTVSSCK